ncbi:MAG: hypothetical protein HYX68_10380 [Planctomycetes bacterium]|jgi:DNA-binding NarL/FixJ family response regulator|nr:hypothetical protein [Planctomycetota bacterium]
MQQTQVLTYGIDGILAERLRELAQVHRFWLRETSQLSACKNLAQTSPPSLLILVLGRDLEGELAFLSKVHESLPTTRSIVIGETDNPILAGLAWDLGAAFVLCPPTPAASIVDLVPKMLLALK